MKYVPLSRAKSARSRLFWEYQRTPLQFAEILELKRRGPNFRIRVVRGEGTHVFETQRSRTVVRFTDPEIELLRRIGALEIACAEQG